MVPSFFSQNQIIRNGLWKSDIINYYIVLKNKIKEHNASPHKVQVKISFSKNLEMCQKHTFFFLSKFGE